MNPDLFPATDKSGKDGILEKAQTFSSTRERTGASGTCVLWVWRAAHPTKWLCKGLLGEKVPVDGTHEYITLTWGFAEPQSLLLGTCSKKSKIVQHLHAEFTDTAPRQVASAAVSR